MTALLSTKRTAFMCHLGESFWTTNSNEHQADSCDEWSEKAHARLSHLPFSPASMGFLSSYLNLLMRKDVHKAHQANEGEMSASWGVETLSFGRTAN